VLYADVLSWFVSNAEFHFTANSAGREVRRMFGTLQVRARVCVCVPTVRQAKEMLSLVNDYTRAMVERRQLRALGAPGDAPAFV
jgi:hypothetical protein